MDSRFSAFDKRLLNDFQRGVPIVARPFRAIARRLDGCETTVIDRLKELRAEGIVSRFGGTCRPNVVGASTLAAVAASVWELDRIAQIINAEPGVNHAYLRENKWNIWFVATGPDRAFVDAALDNISRKAGLRVLDLRLIRPFNIDLGFDLTGPSHCSAAPEPVACPEPGAVDRQLMQEMSDGLPLVQRPFHALGPRSNIPEHTAIAHTKTLVAGGLISRFGVIVRHRPLGWRANAMVVWQVPEARVAQVGPKLARLPGVTLCYQRRPEPDVWPYTLYCMIHARSREDASEVLTRARALPELSNVAHEVLFSSHCYKQTGALITRPEAVA